jgi:hypothetical protein
MYPHYLFATVKYVLGKLLEGFMAHIWAYYAHPMSVVSLNQSSRHRRGPEERVTQAKI